MDFDLVIFDLDGVLVNTSPCHELAFNELWEMLGIAGPPYEVIAGRRTREVIEEYTAEITTDRNRREQWVNFKQERSRHYLKSAQIAFGDSAECILRLTGAGQLLALGTGASRKTVEMVLRRFCWENVFPVVVTGEDVVNGKPAPEIYKAAIKRSGVAAERTLIVEDSVAGLAAAAAANAYSVSVRSGAHIDDRRFIDSFPDIKTMLTALEKGN